MIYNIEFGNEEKISSYSLEDLLIGDIVIFKTSDGEDIGKISSRFSAEAESGPHKDKISANIVRKATLEEYDDSRKASMELLMLCKEKVKGLNLPVKIVSARVQFDRSKLHIDFLLEKKGSIKALVKEIAKLYKEKIVLHQIGHRDLAKRFPAYGICGRPTCCTSFLKEFEPINVDLIKLQNLSCGIAKLTGVCGRLMCCLAFEKESYKK